MNLQSSIPPVQSGNPQVQQESQQPRRIPTQKDVDQAKSMSQIANEELAHLGRRPNREERIKASQLTENFLSLEEQMLEGTIPPEQLNDLKTFNRTLTRLSDMFETVMQISEQIHDKGCSFEEGTCSCDPAVMEIRKNKILEELGITDAK